MPAPIFSNAYGDFSLSRYPTRKNDQLLAWNAADRLLLEEAARRGVALGSALVVNDHHGALSLALQPKALWTDSFLSAIALARNAVLNQCAEPPIIWSTAAPPKVDVVLLQIPKKSVYFEYQLNRCAAALTEGGLLIAGGMDKHLSPNTATLIEKYIGPTHRHRGVKKARIFTAKRNNPPAGVAEHSPLQYVSEHLGATLISQPNVFSGNALDQGSRLLLEHLGALQPVDSLVDLACGNGILGLSAFKKGLCTHVTFCDESAMAIASTRTNATALFPGAPDAFDYSHADGLSDLQKGQAQLILCNPPFHLDHTVDEYVGRRLIQQCADNLPSGGQLLLVCNRHLDYSAALKRKFSRATPIAQNKKFKLLLARKR